MTVQFKGIYKGKHILPLC